MFWKNKKKKEEDSLALSEKAIISLLQVSKKPLSTELICKKVDKLNLGCVDEPSHFLHRLEKKGIIKKEFSKEEKTIFWSLSDKYERLLR